MKKIISICLFFFLFLSCSGETVPEEAKTACKSLQKIRAATQVGITFVNYSELLVEAKMAVNSAETKLPLVYPQSEPKNRLEGINYQMQKAMDVYQAARIAWSHKITNQSLSTTPEGQAILNEYAFLITSKMDMDTVMQKLWKRADASVESLQYLVEK